MSQQQVEYIFCVSTGRSGTNYVSNIFSALEKCVSEHEPQPICNKIPMQRFLNGDESSLRKIIGEKAKQIISSRGDAGIYVETNHCFIKGFGWLLPEYIDQKKIGVIVLKRDRDRVVDSFLRIESTPLTFRGRKWLILPSRKPFICPPPSRWINARFTYAVFRVLSLPFRGKKLYRKLGIPRPPVPAWIKAYERSTLEWYHDETYALAEEYRRKFPEVRYFNAVVDDLNDREKVRLMLETFGYQYDDAIDEVIGRPTNRKEQFVAS